MKRIIALLLALACGLSSGCGRIERKDEQGQNEIIQGENETMNVQNDTEQGNSASHTSYQVAGAEYPEMAQYPDESKYFDEEGYFDDEGFYEVYGAWKEGKRAQTGQYEGYDGGLDGFFTESIREFLGGSNGKNLAYSPLNVYMALAMLAELTGGNSRAQILELLDADSIEALRAQANAIWNANYCDDGAAASVLASSVWLNEYVSFKQATMDSLAENYYASSYRGEMGSAEFDKALQDWLNEQTGGLLEEQAGSIRMDAETILALATTVYFRAKWSSEFNASKTTEGLFHLLDAEGSSVSCDFMHQSDSKAYYWGDKFSSVGLNFMESGNMWFLLPDEGVSVDELLADEQAMDFILADGDWENSKRLVVNMSVPKFDISSQMELGSGLRELGVTDVFDVKVSDFSPMTSDTDDIFISSAQHAARVTIDEEGCVATAFTVLPLLGSAMPPDEEVDFVLDRPFVFVITGESGLPLFVGVVNDPA